MKSFAVVSLLASVAFAQSSLIPSGISSGCSTFLTTLDSDTTLSACTSPLVKATSALLNSSATPSSSEVQSALSSVCASASACSESAIRTKIASFWSSCQTELQAKNADVLALFDTLYTIKPLLDSVCAKDDSGDFCVGSIPSSLTTTSLFTSSSSGSQTVFKPNTDAIKSNDVAFLLLTADTAEATLCTSCARTILTTYVNWESDSPYAPVLANSAFLSNQAALFSAVTTKCGASFLQGAVQAAGSLSSGLLGDSSDSGALANAQTGVAGLSVLLGAITVALASAL